MRGEIAPREYAARMFRNDIVIGNAWAAGNILGAAGTSGGTGDEDEAVCIAGIEAAGLIAG